MSVNKQAFPGVKVVYKGGCGTEKVYCQGMSLRDYFAAKAMEGELAACSSSRPTDLEDVAGFAYKIADAMLKARDET